MSKSKIEKRLPEPQHSKEKKADKTSVSPAIAKPAVICSQNEIKEILKKEFYLIIETEIGIVDLSKLCNGQAKFHLNVDGLATFIHIPIYELAKEIKGIIQKLSEKPAATGSLNYLAK